MKILHTVEFYYPSIGGAQEVVRQVSENLVRMGHEVTIATSKITSRSSNVINGVKILEFDIQGNAVNGIKGEVEKYKKFLLNSKFDIVMNYAAQQWATDLFLEVIDQVRGIKIFAPCGYSALYNHKYNHYFSNISRSLPKYNASIYHSSNYRDIQFARKHNATNIKIIPYGADEKEFSIQSSNKGYSFRHEFKINNFFTLTVGNHTGEKGHLESMLSFFISPITNATLVIIGELYSNTGCYFYCKSLSMLLNIFSIISRKKVILLSLPREKTVQAFKEADLFLFLSRIENSPIVLYEATAAGLPYIATSVGNSKELANLTKSGVITKTFPKKSGRVRPSIFFTAHLLSKLYRNSSLRKSLGLRGRLYWRKHWTWEKISKQYIGLYKNLLKDNING